MGTLKDMTQACSMILVKSGQVWKTINRMLIDRLDIVVWEGTYEYIS